MANRLKYQMGSAIPFQLRLLETALIEIRDLKARVEELETDVPMGTQLHVPKENQSRTTIMCPLTIPLEDQETGAESQPET